LFVKMSAEEMPGLTLAERDLAIWKEGAGY